MITKGPSILYTGKRDGNEGSSRVKPMDKKRFTIRIQFLKYLKEHKLGYQMFLVSVFVFDICLFMI